MTRTQRWLTAVAVVGVTAGAAAAALLWMVVTRPVALAEVISRVW